MTRPWLGIGAAGAVLVAAMSVVAAAPAAAVPDSKARAVLNDVHTDAVHVEYVDGRLALKTRAGGAPYQFYEASDVIFQVRDAGQLAVPEQPEYAFLGPPNSPVWIAPQVQDPSLLFAGWDTENVPAGVLAADAIDLHLRGVSGPGKVEVFQTDGVGQPARIFSSADAAYTSHREAAGHHVHANWAFGAPGRYRLTFEVTATTTAGAAVSSGLVDYTWYVGGTNPQDVIAEPTTTTLTAAPGVTLTGTAAPANAPGWVEFFDGTTSLGYSDVSNGKATFTTQSLPAGTHTLTAKFIPRYSNDYQSSTSAPVTYEVVGGPPSSSTKTSSSTTRTTTSAQPTSTTSGAGTSESTPPSTTTTSCVPATSRTGVVLDQGHVDYAARIVNGRLTSQVKDGTSGTPQWRSPSQVVFHLKDAAATTVPSDAFAFLGPASSKIWQIPQTQKPDVVWLGWNTEEITTAQVTGEVKWQITEVSGPGSMAIYELDPFGKPVVIFNSKDGLPDTYNIRLGTHAHGNWAFTAAGAYRLTFTHTVTLAAGATVSDKQVVTFAVGGMDPKTLLPTTTTGCGADGGTSAAASRLASTGASILGPLAVGGVLVLLGASLLFLLRRRKLNR